MKSKMKWSGTEKGKEDRMIRGGDDDGAYHHIGINKDNYFRRRREIRK